MEAPGSSWQPHGDVIYRTDALGERVGVLPATCRRGEHSLHAVGYRAIDTGAGFLNVSCNACAAHTPPRHDYYWALRITAPPPARAELDDQPYAELLARQGS